MTLASLTIPGMDATTTSPELETQVGPYFARVYRDESYDTTNPRQDYDHLGTITWFGSFDSRMGTLEDETVSMRDCGFCADWSYKAAEHCPLCDGSGELPPSFGDDVVIPLDVFEDWLPRISFESSLRESRGAIHVSRAKIVEEYGAFTSATAKKARQVLRAEVEEYNAYLAGDVYFWAVETEDDATVDAVYGFIGETDYPLSEAVAHAEYLVAQNAEEARERAYWAARDVETVETR